MRTMNESTTSGVLKTLHPSWFHYSGMLTAPLVLFGLVFIDPNFFEVDFLNVSLVVLVIETFLVVFCLVHWRTTTYLVMADRVEVKAGILVKTSQSVMYNQIIGVVTTQTVTQGLFGVGNIYIVTAGGKAVENNLVDVHHFQKIADFFTDHEGGTP